MTKAHDRLCELVKLKLEEKAMSAIHSTAADHVLGGAEVL